MTDEVLTKVETPVVKKLPQNFYFTQETEDAIVEYNNTDDVVVRNKLYTEKIHHALYKIAEIMMHRYKFYNFDIPYEDVKHEVIVFLHEKLCKYDQTTGFKAYSYFSIVAKNYLIAENNKNYYQTKKKDTVDAIDLNRNLVNEVIRTDFIEETKDFIDMFVEVMGTYLPMIFPKQRDLQIADAVLYLFENRENIENYNKKALYLLIKERTADVKSQYITAVIKTLKLMYSRLYREYNDGIDITELSWYNIKDIIEE